eukprot:15335349-Ditylum_brightwellii.AAC.1
MLKWLEGKYGKLRTTRGKAHEYLGMTLDFTKKGKVKVVMKEYIQEIIDNFAEAITKSVASPAADHLFTVNKDCPALGKDMGRAFHTSTAKLLFLCKRAWPDIQTAVSFLTTRVKNPDEDNWKKLHKVITYLNGTKELVLTLGADSLNFAKWWVDGAFAVHPDMKGHTGVTMSFGQGSLLS